MQLIYRNMQSYFAFLRLNALIGFIFEVSLHVLIIISLFALLCLTNKDPQDVGFSLLMLLSLGYMFSLKYISTPNLVCVARSTWISTCRTCIECSVALMYPAKVSSSTTTTTRSN
jgi:hypothetical protein